jgi:NADPH-dependent curcumin reductase
MPLLAQRITWFFNPQEAPSMSQSTTVDRSIVLNARPRGAPTAADFRIEDDQVPKPGAGQLLLRTLYLSLDP